MTINQAISRLERLRAEVGGAADVCMPDGLLVRWISTKNGVVYVTDIGPDDEHGMRLPEGDLPDDDNDNDD